MVSEKSCMLNIKHYANVDNICPIVSLQDKSAEIKRLSEAVVSLVKSGDQEANSAAEKVDHLTKQIQRLHRVTEVRIKLSLLYVSFHRLLQQVSTDDFFMPPTLKKWGAYCFRLVRLSVCPSVRSKQN